MIKDSRDLIYREAAIKAFNLNFGSVQDAVDARQILESLPAVDAQPVVHGRWLDKNEFTCSECGYEWMTSAEYPGAKYCPNCGAKMDGGSYNE